MTRDRSAGNDVRAHPSGVQKALEIIDIAGEQHVAVPCEHRDVRVDDIVGAGSGAELAGGS